MTRFKAWATRYVRGAEHMNVCSGAQVRQLLFAGAANGKAPDDPSKRLELSRIFKVRQLCHLACSCGKGCEANQPCDGRVVGQKGKGGEALAFPLGYTCRAACLNPSWLYRNP